MSSKLDALIALQKALNHADNLRHDIRDLPKKIEEVEKEKQAVKDALEAEKETLKGHRTALKNAELDLGTAESDLQKKQVQLHSIKTNKEYTAMQHEIEALKKKMSDREDTILTLMDKVEEEVTRLKVHEDESKQKEKALDEQIAALRKDLASREEELVGADVIEKEARANVHPSVLGVFDKLYERNHGKAVVPVVDTTCGYCSVSLTPQTLAQVHDGWDIIRCEGCSSILYEDK